MSALPFRAKNRVLVPLGMLAVLRRAAALGRQRLRGWRVRQRDLHHLRQLDDWQLADMGLTRGTLEPAVRGTFDPHRTRLR